MFDLPYPSHQSNYNNRFIFLSLIGSIVVVCIIVTLLLKCLILGWAKFCKRGRNNVDDPNKRPTTTTSIVINGDHREDSHLNLTNVLVVQDTYINPYCQNGTHTHGGGGSGGCGGGGVGIAGERPYSIFQFSTDDISLAFTVQGIQPVRRPDITKSVYEEIIVEALKQRKRQLNPTAKSSILNKRPSDEAIFDVQMQLLNHGNLGENVLERKYSFFSNILRIQRIVEEVWEILEEREPLLLDGNERWVCKLMLEANMRIDNTIADHQMNPDMMCALAFIDAPLFLTPRGSGSTRRGPPVGCGSHHALCAHGCGGGGQPSSRRSSSTRSSTRSAYHRFVREMEQPPPKFESIVGTHGQDDGVEPPPPSYDDCVGTGAAAAVGNLSLDGKTHQIVTGAN